MGGKAALGIANLAATFLPSSWPIHSQARCSSLYFRVWISCCTRPAALKVKSAVQRPKGSRPASFLPMTLACQWAPESARLWSSNSAISSQHCVQMCFSPFSSSAWQPRHLGANRLSAKSAKSSFSSASISFGLYFLSYSSQDGLAACSQHFGPQLCAKGYRCFGIVCSIISTAFLTIIGT